MDNAKYLGRMALGLFAALALVLSFAATAGAQDGGRDREVNNKCCKPATAQPPGPASCPVPPCRTSVICTPFSGTGSWSNGGCTDQEKKHCLDSSGELGLPKYVCGAVPCTLPDGTQGVTCGWVGVGLSDKTQTVTSCNGDPCA